MSPAVIYAAALIIVMCLFSGCARTLREPETKRARVTCRGGPPMKRSAPWSPPRVR